MFRITPYERRAFDLFSEFEKEFFNLGKSVQAHCRTDIKDEGSSFVLEMEIPGFEKEDINIDIKGDYLTISANKNTESDSNDGKYIRRERTVNSCQRSFDISNIETEKIAAEYKNGLLIINMPKKGKCVPESRRLEIS